jgi:hypothetical protein
MYSLRNSYPFRGLNGKRKWRFDLAWPEVALAVKVDGDARVTGTLSKGGGSFRIDHPLDPANKYRDGVPSNLGPEVRDANLHDAQFFTRCSFGVDALSRDNATPGR